MVNCEDVYTEQCFFSFFLERIFYWQFVYVFPLPARLCRIIAVPSSGGFECKLTTERHH